MINDAAVFAKITEWQDTIVQLQTMAPLVTREKQLRQELFALVFPAPKEGTNNETLPGDWTIKGNLKIDRKVDEAALPGVLQAIRDQGYNPDLAVRYKPEVVSKPYKEMPDEIRKLFETALTIKPALPTIELIPPKEQT